MLSAGRSSFGRRFVEALLACVLLSAAAAKSYQLWRGIPSPLLIILHNRVFLVLAIQAEMALGLWLLTGGLSRARFFVTIGCFAVFSCIAGWETLQDLPSCGCFGEIRIPPWGIALFDVAAVIALWFTRPQKNEGVRDTHWGARFAGAAIAFAVLSIIPWRGLLRNAPAGKEVNPLHAAGEAVVLRPEDWLNRAFPLLDVIDVEELRRGRWCLFLYHYDCPVCLKALPGYIHAAVTKSQKGGSHFGFIAVPPYADDAEDPVPASPEYGRWKLPVDREWFVTTPTVITLQDGKVIAIAQGEETLTLPN